VAGPALDYLSGRVTYASGGAITIVVFLELGLVTLWIAAGAGQQRRSHFWVRISMASLVLPSLVAVVVELARLNVLPDAVARGSSLFFVGVVALMFVPGLLYRGSGSSPGPSESDGGGGVGPEPPRFSPDAPRGGVPLPDAAQASVRARDHNAPRFDGPHRRGPAHKPGRAPARTEGRRRSSA
jgi:hypothetical protein